LFSKSQVTVSGLSISNADSRHGLKRAFNIACEDLKPTRHFVVNSGNERYRLSEQVEAIGLKDLATELAAL
jgi:hypothetical protein